MNTDLRGWIRALTGAQRSEAATRLGRPLSAAAGRRLVHPRFVFLCFLCVLRLFAVFRFSTPFDALNACSGQAFHFSPITFHPLPLLSPDRASG
jgi:hypothetical protein